MLGTRVLCRARPICPPTPVWGSLFPQFSQVFINSLHLLQELTSDFVNVLILCLFVFHYYLLFSLPFTCVEFQPLFLGFFLNGYLDHYFRPFTHMCWEHKWSTPLGALIASQEFCFSNCSTPAIQGFSGSVGPDLRSVSPDCARTGTVQGGPFNPCHTEGTGQQTQYSALVSSSPWPVIPWWLSNYYSFTYKCPEHYSSIISGNISFTYFDQYFLMFLPWNLVRNILI